MRYIFVTPEGVIDTLTGELTDRLSLGQLMTCEPGGVIAGVNLYPLLAGLADEARSQPDTGWTFQVHKQDRGGVIYIPRLSYRRGKVGSRGKRRRPPAIKWLVLNLELFTETDDVEAAARALVSLAERRGIRPRHSPGAFGSAMLRTSDEWGENRQPAPWFISELAREHLPGNYYATRTKYRTVPRAFYVDQQAAHHTVAATTPMPHPERLRARGRLRAVERGHFPRWIGIEKLKEQIGLLACVVECRSLAASEEHLYPQWARIPGRRNVWIWTPELRLLNAKVQLLHVSAALTSYKLDTALWEYAEWAMEQLAREDKHSAIKPALLAAYGMLAVRCQREFTLHTVHNREKPARAEVVTLPLLERVYRSTVKRRRVPSIQNVVARGVIEAEVRTRSIEYARQLEGIGVPVVHIYADGLIAACDNLPFPPNGWRVSATLTDVSAPAPNAIQSRELKRRPGVPNGRATVYIRPDAQGYHPRECEPNVR